MWFIYLVCIIIALWHFRGLIRKLVSSANEFASLAEGTSECFLREEGAKLSEKLMKVEGKKLPSDVLAEFRSKN
jgi:hypothetical protein